MDGIRTTMQARCNKKCVRNVTKRSKGLCCTALKNMRGITYQKEAVPLWTVAHNISNRRWRYEKPANISRTPAFLWRAQMSYSLNTSWLKSFLHSDNSPCIWLRLQSSPDILVVKECIGGFSVEEPSRIFDDEVKKKLPRLQPIPVWKTIISSYQKFDDEADDDMRIILWQLSR